MPKRASQWPKVARMCKERDEKSQAKCWICGGTIDYNASNNPSNSRYSPDAYEPDHVLSVAEYPELELDMDNIKASHSSCNRSRRDKSLKKQVFKSSRDWGI